MGQLPADETKATESSCTSRRNGQKAVAIAAPAGEAAHPVHPVHRAELPLSGEFVGRGCFQPTPARRYRVRPEGGSGRRCGAPADSPAPVPTAAVPTVREILGPAAVAPLAEQPPAKIIIDPPPRSPYRHGSGIST
jgi:hypothetical protein